MIFESGMEAAGFGSRGGSSGSRGGGFSRSSSWSVPTHNTWDRSGGGLLGPTPGSSSGYSKPSLQKTPTPSGYSKPSLTGPPTSGQSVQTGSKASGGYAKPGASSVTGERFTGGSKFDKETIGLERKKRSQESLRSTSLSRPNSRTRNSKLKEQSRVLLPRKERFTPGLTTALITSNETTIIDPKDTNRPDTLTTARRASGSSIRYFCSGCWITLAIGT